MEQLQLFVAILSFAALIFAQKFGNSLKDQDQWSADYSLCGSSRQSPIALYTDTATEENFAPLWFFGYDWDFPRPRILENNGRSAGLTIAADRLASQYFTPHVSGSILNGTYLFENLHFHWGEDNSEGSEHSIDDVTYSSEMHILHRNMRYNYSEATQRPDGFVVLGAMITPSINDNPAFDPIIKHLQYIRNYPSNVSISEIFTLRSILGNIKTGTYFTYPGSMTSPPCPEAVTWIFFLDVLKMSTAQLDELRQLTGENGEPLSGNFRQLQPLNDRHGIHTKRVDDRLDLTSIKVLNNLVVNLFLSMSIYK